MLIPPLVFAIQCVRLDHAKDTKAFLLEFGFLYWRYARPLGNDRFYFPFLIFYPDDHFLFFQLEQGFINFGKCYTILKSVVFPQFIPDILRSYWLIICYDL